MNVLSIQSSVAYGHVGNSGAVFALRRLGHEAWALDTVTLSNHPGHGRWRGRVTPAPDLSDLLDGLDELGVLGRCHAVLTGYLGTSDNGVVALEAVSRVRRNSPAALYLCDPVIGNERKGIYVEPDVAAFVRDRALPAADIVTPNCFEVGFLTGTTVTTADEAIAAARTLIDRGPHIVVVTGLRRGDEIGVLAATAEGVWLVETPCLDTVADDGAGDLFAALLLGHFLTGRDLTPAVERAVAGTFAVFDASRAAGELRLVDAQARMVDPDQVFAATKVG
jgi:pyridoxine kinase